MFRIPFILIWIRDPFREITYPDPADKMTRIEVSIQSLQNKNNARIRKQTIEIERKERKKEKTREKRNLEPKIGENYGTSLNILKLYIYFFYLPTTPCIQARFTAAHTLHTKYTTMYNIYIINTKHTTIYI